MTFNDTTNLNGAIQECESWLFGGNYGAISSDSTLLKRFTSLINYGCNKTAIEIYKADAKWQYDDSNYDDLPEATTDLAASISNYTLLTEHLIVQGVEILNNVGDYVPLRQIDYREIRNSGQTETEFYKEPGLPMYYDIKGDQLVLFPAPKATDVTLADGLKLIFKRQTEYFVSTDTTKSFAFPQLFEDLPVLFACSKYAKQNTMTDKVKEIDNEILLVKGDIKGFINDRNNDKKKRIRPAYRSAM